MTYIFDRVNLHLFEGGEGSAPAGDAQGEAQATPVTTRRGKSGEYSNVVFGKQTAEPEAQAPVAGEPKKDAVTTTSNTLEDRRKAYHDFVNGEYKDIHTQELQRMIDRRFKETRSLQEQNEKNQPIIDMLMQKYKVSDASKLMEAIDNDDMYWSEAAEEAGLSVEQYKEFQKLERQNTSLLREQQARMQAQSANAKMQEWYQESEAMKTRYPGFDLNAEVQNEQFLSLLRANVPVEHAYKVVHYDELVSDAMTTSAREAEQKVIENVRAKGNRPAENGTAAQSAFIVKDDPSKFTKKDRTEIARRVARGEQIVL